MCRHGRILDHDGNAQRIGQGRVEIVDLRFADPERRAMIGRHDHHHGGAHVLGAPAALDADRRAEVAGGDDDRHAAVHALQDLPRQDLALLVGQQELLRIVRQHAQAIDAGVDHELHAAALTVQVQAAVVVEDRRHDGVEAAMAGRMGEAHGIPIREDGGIR